MKWTVKEAQKEQFEQTMNDNDIVIANCLNDGIVYNGKKQIGDKVYCEYIGSFTQIKKIAHIANKSGMFTN
jgi:hypothetical protein